MPAARAYPNIAGVACRRGSDIPRTCHARRAPADSGPRRRGSPKHVPVFQQPQRKAPRHQEADSRHPAELLDVIQSSADGGDPPDEQARAAIEQLILLYGLSGQPAKAEELQQRLQPT